MEKIVEEQTVRSMSPPELALTFQALFYPFGISRNDSCDAQMTLSMGQIGSAEWQAYYIYSIKLLYY